MQDDSAEEAEYKFDQELELLMNDPGYRSASWEEFIIFGKKHGKNKVITAKRLWLQFTEKGQSIPSDIEKVLFEAIKKDVIDYDREHPQSSSRIKYEDVVFELLNTAREDLDHFWKLLHGPNDSVFVNVETPHSSILKTLRKWLPKRKKINIYAIFEGLFEDPPSPIIDSSEAFQQRFRDWRDKNIKQYSKKTK